VDPLKTPIVPREPHETEQEFQSRVTEEFLANLVLLFDLFGISPNEPDASTKMVLALAQKHYSGFRVRSSGNKAVPQQTADDLILACGVELRGTESILQAIAGLKKHNGWTQSVETLRRRYYLLQRTKSREHRRMAEMAAAFLPRIQEHFKAK